MSMFLFSEDQNRAQVLNISGTNLNIRTTWNRVSVYFSPLEKKYKNYDLKLLKISLISNLV